MKFGNYYYYLMIILLAHFASPVGSMTGRQQSERPVTTEYFPNASKFNSPVTGFRGRITEKAFDYFADKAVDLLMTQVPYIKIPSQFIRDGSSTLSIHSLELQLDRPQLQINYNAGNGITLNITSLKTYITGAYRVRGCWFIFCSSGTGRAHISADLSLDIKLTMRKNQGTGRPTEIIPMCFTEGYVDISFRGDYASKINSAASGEVDKIKRSIAPRICSVIQENIDKYMKPDMNTILVNEKIAGLFEFNIGLTEYPTFNNDYLETSHKGEAHLHDIKTESPYKPAFIPEFVNHTDKMIYLYLTDYVPNSALYAAYQGGILNYYVPNEKFPIKVKEFLNLSCEFPTMCLGTISPELSKKYPSGRVEIEIHAAKCPYIHFIDGYSAALFAPIGVDVFIKDDGNVSHLFEIDFSVALDIDVKVNDSLLSFDVKSLCTYSDHDLTDIDKLWSCNGDLNTGRGVFYETAIRLASQHLLLPKLEELGNDGFLLPSSVYGNLTNPEIIPIPGNGVFVVATDVTIPTDLNLIELLDIKLNK